MLGASAVALWHSQCVFSCSLSEFHNKSLFTEADGDVKMNQSPTWVNVVRSPTILVGDWMILTVDHRSIHYSMTDEENVKYLTSKPTSKSIKLKNVAMKNGPKSRENLQKHQYLWACTKISFDDKIRVASNNLSSKMFVYVSVQVVK